MRVHPKLLTAALLLLGCAALGADSVSPAVQVGINYGPGKSTMISGVIVGGGDLVLTQANLLVGAKEIVIALSNKEVLDAQVVRVDDKHNVALLRMLESVSAPLTLLDAVPPGPVTAQILGMPEAFRLSKTAARLQPIEGKAAWSIEPRVPPGLRGAAIVSVSGTLLGIVVEPREGVPAAGVCITELSGFIAGEPAPQDASPVGVPRNAAPDKAVEQARPEQKAEPPAGAAKGDSQSREAPARPAEAQPVSATPPAQLTEMKAVKQPSALEQRSPDTPPVPKAADQQTAKVEAVRGREDGVAAGAVPSPAVSAVASPAGAAEKPREAAAETVTPKPDNERTPQLRSPKDEWKLRIAAEPNNAELRFAFADALLGAASYDEAIAVLLKALDDFPSEPAVYWHLGKAYWDQGVHKDDGTPRRTMDRTSYRNCVAAFQKFVDRAPGDTRAVQARILLEALRKTRH